MLTFAVLLVTDGRLADIYGRRRMFRFGRGSGCARHGGVRG
jgi:hypothetical protein